MSDALGSAEIDSVDPPVVMLRTAGDAMRAEVLNRQRDQLAEVIGEFVDGAVRVRILEVADSEGPAQAS